MRYLRLFKVKKEELWASLIALVAFIVLHILLISKYFDLFSDPKAHFWDVFIKNFRMSGFDPITYAVTTEWGTFYNVYRHPLLAFFVWPFYAINQGLTALFGINLVQLVIALPLLFFSYYTFIFIYRIFREVIGISRTDSTVLSALFFSFAYTIVTFIVPDHFAITCFMLVTTLYLSGKCIQKGRHLNRLQTILLFFFTAGVTLTNGIKVFIDALFVNGKRFFRPSYFLPAVILPALVIWGAARLEYHTTVQPRVDARNEVKMKKDRELRAKMWKEFLDTTSIRDEAKQKAAFNEIIRQKALNKYRRDQEKPWNKHKGKPMGKGEFEQWTDISTSRTESFVENLFGESFQLHEDHLMGDTLRGRPVLVYYNSVWNYIVEGIICVLFILGIWCGRRSRFLWMALTSFAFDLIIHMVLGFGINEVYIMSGGWLFVVPIAIAYAFKNIRGRLHIALRLLIILLALWLYVWNLRLLIGYLVS